MTIAISVPAGISFPPMTTSAAVSFSVMLKGGIQRSPSCTVAADRPRGSAATAAACSVRGLLETARDHRADRPGDLLGGAPLPVRQAVVDHVIEGAPVPAGAKVV